MERRVPFLDCRCKLDLDGNALKFEIERIVKERRCDTEGEVESLVDSRNERVIFGRLDLKTLANQCTQRASCTAAIERVLDARLFGVDTEEHRCEGGVGEGIEALFADIRAHRLIPFCR